MIIPVARLIVRLSFLFLIVYSIFYFYVLGYRYNLQSKISYQTAGIYDFRIYGNIDYIKIWNKVVFLTDHKVVLYSLPEWTCSNLKIWGSTFRYCFDWKYYNKFVYFSRKDIKISVFDDKTFFKLSLVNWNDFFEKYNFKWNGIEFSYQKNGDLLYKDDFWYKKLLNLSWVDFIGYVMNGLIFEKKGRLYELRFN